MKKFFLKLFFLILILFIYKNWFWGTDIIGGDWPYFFQEAINSFSFVPPAWSSIHGNGLGGTFIVYALDSYLYFIGWFFSNILNIPWVFAYKFFLFWNVFIFMYSFHFVFVE